MCHCAPGRSCAAWIPMRAILMAAVLMVTACGGGMDDGKPGGDAAIGCEITDERGRSCSRVCTAFTPADLAASQLCDASATWDVCVDECVAGVSVRGWCP